jgi:ATP-dependent protease ClpP protease subunit
MKNEVQPFYRFRAEAGDEPASAELLIFSVIGDWEDFGEQSAKGFASDLSKLPSSVKRLDIHINSPGGSVSEAMAIYSRLADHRSDKHVYIDGLAASAASLIAMVGHKVYIRANANMMIHLPMAIALGNADDMRTVIAALDSHTESMLNVYSRKTKLPREDIRSLMAAETWFHADAAVEKGFADEVRGVVKAAALIDEKRVMINGMTFDLSRFHNVPAFTGEQQKGNMQTKPTAENEPATDPAPPAEPPKPPAEAPKPPAETTPPPADPPAEPAAATAAPAETDIQKAIRAERERVSALQKLDRPATHEIITKAIADGKSVADVSSELFDALEKAGTQQARRTDAVTLTTIPPSDTSDASANNGFGKLIKEKALARTKQMRPMAHSRN